MEFGATYPYEAVTPRATGAELLWQFRGAHGAPLSGMTEEAIFAALPSHARSHDSRFPAWKRTFIRQNRALYQRHRSWLDTWRPQLLQFAPSFQKFEWNAKGEARDLSQLILQVRASGLRAKRATTAPSLVAMTTTQVPIVTWEQRYMTPHECARLQSMDDLELPNTATRAYEALGNAVNVHVVGLVAQALLVHRAGADATRRTSNHQRTLLRSQQNGGSSGGNHAQPEVLVQVAASSSRDLGRG